MTSPDLVLGVGLAVYQTLRGVPADVRSLFGELGLQAFTDVDAPRSHSVQIARGSGVQLFGFVLSAPLGGGRASS